MTRKFLSVIAAGLLLTSCFETWKGYDDFKSQMNDALEKGCRFNADIKTLKEIFDIIGIAFPGVNAITKVSDMAEKICAKVKAEPKGTSFDVVIRGTDNKSYPIEVTGKRK